MRGQPFSAPRTIANAIPCVARAHREYSRHKILHLQEGFLTTQVSITQQQTIVGTQEDWTQAVPFEQFDPSTGTLLDAAFTTSGSITASVSIENLAPTAAGVDVLVSGTVVATAPDIGVVGSIAPEVDTTVNLGGFQGIFDGTPDFDSPSGTILPAIAGTQTQTAVFNTGSLGTASFVGTGPSMSLCRAKPPRPCTGMAISRCC